jgi:hypothetical protein
LGETTIAPHFARARLRRDALGSKPGVSDREAQDALLDHLRQLIGHDRPTALAGPEHLESVTVDLTLPVVVGRAVHPERATRRGHARATGLGEQLQAIAEQHVILGHQLSSLTWR